MRCDVSVSLSVRSILFRLSTLPSIPTCIHTYTVSSWFHCQFMVKGGQVVGYSITPSVLCCMSFICVLLYMHTAWVSILQKREAFYNNILNTALFREFALVNRFVQTESSLTSVHQSLHAVLHVFLCCYISFHTAVSPFLLWKAWL